MLLDIVSPLNNLCFLFVLYVYKYKNVIQFPKDANLVYLEGYLTEKPYTKIAKNVERKLSSFCIAVRRKDSKRKEDADYINCLAWTDNADLIESIEPKEKVKMYGRMQSRKVNGYEVYFITVRNFL